MTLPTPMPGEAAPTPDAASPDAYNQPLPFGLHRLTQGLNALGTLIISPMMISVPRALSPWAR